MDDRTTHDERRADWQRKTADQIARRAPPARPGAMRLVRRGAAGGDAVTSLPKIVRKLAEHPDRRATVTLTPVVGRFLDGR